MSTGGIWWTMSFYYFYIDLENLENLMAWNWGHLKVYEMILQGFWVKCKSKIDCKFFLHLSLTNSMKQLIKDPKIRGGKKRFVAVYFWLQICFSGSSYCLWEGSWCRWERCAWVCTWVSMPRCYRKYRYHLWLCRRHFSSLNSMNSGLV